MRVPSWAWRSSTATASSMPRNADAGCSSAPASHPRAASSVVSPRRTSVWPTGKLTPRSRASASAAALSHGGTSSRGVGIAPHDASGTRRNDGAHPATTASCLSRWTILRPDQARAGGPQDRSELEGRDLAADALGVGDRPAGEGAGGGLERLQDVRVVLARDREPVDQQAEDGRADDRAQEGTDDAAPEAVGQEDGEVPEGEAHHDPREHRHGYRGLP